MRRILLIAISLALGLSVDWMVETATGAEFSPTFLISTIVIYYILKKLISRIESE